MAFIPGIKECAFCWIMLSGIIMLGVLRFSADQLVALDRQNTENSMQQAVDNLEKQYQILEDIVVHFMF